VSVLKVAAGDLPSTIKRLLLTEADIQKSFPHRRFQTFGLAEITNCRHVRAFFEEVPPDARSKGTSCPRRGNSGKVKPQIL